MSIASQIEALQNDKSAIANAITAKGGTVVSGDGFDDFANAINGIEIGDKKIIRTTWTPTEDTSVYIANVPFVPNFIVIENMDNSSNPPLDVVGTRRVYIYSDLIAKESAPRYSATVVQLADDGITPKTATYQLPKGRNIRFDVPNYNSSATYKNLNTMVLYDNAVYKCITTVTVPEEFDPNKWEAISEPIENIGHILAVNLLPSSNFDYMLFQGGCEFTVTIMG